MKKHSLLNGLAAMTAHLEPVEPGNSDSLRRLRYELATQLMHQGSEELTEDDNEPGVESLDDSINTGLRQELSEIIRDVMSLPPETAYSRRIVERDTSQINITQHLQSWTMGQQPALSIGPFTNLIGRLLWFDIYQPVRLNSIIFAGDSLPFIKFSFFGLWQTAVNTVLNLGPGSIWLRAKYFDPQVPANGYAGFKVDSATLQFSESFQISGSNVIVNPNSSVRLTMRLHQTVITDNSHIAAGKDALACDIKFPREVTINFRSGNAHIEHIAETRIRVYGNDYHFVYQNQSCVYKDKIRRLLIPLDNNKNSFDPIVVHSTLFNSFGSAKLKGSYWALIITIDDHTKLGEASGNGGFLFETAAGLKADWAKLSEGPVALNDTQWIFEPGRIELRADQADTMLAKQRFLLWNEDEKNKRSSLSIRFLKKSFLQYFSLAEEELELVQVDANIKGNLDRPLSTDGKRMIVEYNPAQYVLGQYKQDLFIQCSSSKNLKKKIELKAWRELKPISLALSNAFAKISPCDEFILYGLITGDNSIEKGICSYVFGLYSLIPIFPDPYVTNIRMITEGRRAEFFPREEFGNYLQAIVKWNSIEVAELSFGFRASGAALFTRLQPTRKDVYERLASAASRKNISYQINTVDENGNQIISFLKATDLIEEDRQNNQYLKNYYQDQAGGLQFPELFLLDVSGNSDQFGIGLPTRSMDAVNNADAYRFEGLELVAPVKNLSIFTLPPFQWEPVSTVQNPNTLPYPFPSPVQFIDTGNPAIISPQQTFHLLPITPGAVINDLVKSLKNIDPASNSQGSMLLTSLPFGMQAVLKLQQYFNHGILYQGVKVINNRPQFADKSFTGGNQISFTALTMNNDVTDETARFDGATYQNRNLIDNNRDVLGLSVLGPIVDLVFNKEFKPGGHAPRVPIQRIDLSGYGASMFSNWRNPQARIAATSQAKFDVMIGRTAHEVVQIKSILYACGASVVRTITIQRTASGNVTRHDSGWTAEGPGLFDFSYGQPKINPYVFHKGVIKGYYNITNIRDTLRIVRIAPIEAGDEPAELQEVIYDASLKIDDVIKGEMNGFLLSKGQKGFVQLAPSGKPISAGQFKFLLLTEGPIGGPVDGIMNVGLSGQEMRIMRADVNASFASNACVNAVRGSLLLPNEGTWAIVKNKDDNIEPVIDNMGLPLVQYNAAPLQYEFTEPSLDPNIKFGLLHAGSAHRTLFLRPLITRNDPVISTDQPFFADLFALKNSYSHFPKKQETFTVGAGSGKLKVHGSGLLELISSGKINITGNQRIVSEAASLKTYVEYSDRDNNPTTGSIMINSQLPDSWKVELTGHKLLYDVDGHTGLFLFNIDFNASQLEKPKFNKPVVEYGSFLKPLTDILRFLEGFDPSEPFDLDITNKSSHKNMGIKIKSALSIKFEFELVPIHIKLKFPDKNSMKVKGFPPTKPPEIKVKGELKIALGGFAEKKTDGSSSDGLIIVAKAETQIKIFTLTSLDAIYAVGILEYQMKVLIDGMKTKHSFKAAVGACIKIRVSYIEIEVARSFGVQLEKGDWAMILSQSGQLEIATVIIGITIEGKAQVERKEEDGEDKTYGIFELCLIIEISVAYVLNFEFEFSWEEEVRIC